MKRRLSLLMVVALLIAGCAKKKRTPAVPAAPGAAAAMPRVGDEETGIASWYGHPYHGRRASNGEIYDMDKLTAAHRTLPFGTMVLVENLDNERTVTVRIIDRGPFVEGRVIDLSRAAAQEIRMIGPGTARVRLRVTAVPQEEPGSYFAVQAGAFRDRGNADRRRLELEKRYGQARVTLRNGDQPLWRVLVGHEDTEAGAAALAGRVKAEVGPAFVVRVDPSESDL